MRTTQSIEIGIDSTNPGEYLAVCGVLELVGRFDKFAKSVWTRRSGFVPGLPAVKCDVCEISTTVSEGEFVESLLREIRSPEAWRAVTRFGRTTLAEASGQWVAGVELKLWNGSLVVIDHWYEHAYIQKNQIVQKVSNTRDGKGRWKFWAGHHDNMGLSGLLPDYLAFVPKTLAHPRVTSLFREYAPGASSFKIDAQTTRSALDRGISANDAAKNEGSHFRPAMEILALIGASSFFPPRHSGPDVQGTCGFVRREFHYATWAESVGLNIARILCRGTALPKTNTTKFVSALGMMGQYTYLRQARSTGDQSRNSLTDNLDYEDDDDSDE